MLHAPAPHRESLQRFEQLSRAFYEHNRPVAKRHLGGAVRFGQQAYAREVRRDFSHKTSHDLTAKPVAGTVPVLALSFEALKPQNMMRRPKPRKDGNGRWQRNGAKRKAGLNKAIAASCWGAINQQTKYKAARRNVLHLEVPAAYSSQECSHCAHTHPGNREGERFACQSCEFTEHADINAGVNIARRGVEVIRSGELKAPKARKRLSKPRRKTKTGPVRPDVPVESA